MTADPDAPALPTPEHRMRCTRCKYVHAEWAHKMPCPECGGVSSERVPEMPSRIDDIPPPAPPPGGPKPGPNPFFPHDPKGPTP